MTTHTVLISSICVAAQASDRPARRTLRSRIGQPFRVVWSRIAEYPGASDTPSQELIARYGDSFTSRP